MNIRNVIFISLLCVSYSLHCMEDIHQKETISHRPTPLDLIFIKKISDQFTLPHDIARIILKYLGRLGYSEFKKYDEIHLKRWKNFNIPFGYFYLLSKEQMSLIQKLFASDPTYLVKTRLEEDFYEVYYFLESRKEYKLFLTLPIEVRKCLTQLPSFLSKTRSKIIKDSLITQNTSDYKNTHLVKAASFNHSSIRNNINQDRVILVKTRPIETKLQALNKNKFIAQHQSFKGYKPKLIIPEEKKSTKSKLKELTLEHIIPISDTVFLREEEKK